MRNNSAGRKGTLVFAHVGQSSSILFLFKHPDNVAVKLFPGLGTKCLCESAQSMVGLQSGGSLAGVQCFLGCRWGVNFELGARDTPQMTKSLVLVLQVC